MGDNAQPQGEERQLVVQAQRRDAEAFRALVDRYDKRLLYFVRRLLGETEDAFDVVQAIWLQVFRSLPRLSAPQAFRVWLYRIAYAQIVTVLRRQHIVLNDAEPLIADVADDSASDTAFDDAELVHKALANITVEHRRILVLRFLEDMSLEEIAVVLECPSGTIKSRLHYAKAALRARIKEFRREI